MADTAKDQLLALADIVDTAEASVMSGYVDVAEEAAQLALSALANALRHAATYPTES